MSLLAAAVLSATATTSIYSDYPTFANPNAVIEAYTNKGPILNLIVKCPGGAGIMSHSRIERLCCSSKHNCSASLRTAMHDTSR